MAKLVVLLRGINVGGHAKIAMADLKALLDDLGFTDVTTVLQTGNVVLESSLSPEKAGAQIQAAIADRSGIAPKVMARTKRQFLSVIEKNPYPEAASDGKTLHVAFLERTPDSRTLGTIDPEAFLPDRWTVVGKEIYVHLPNGMARTKVFDALSEKRLGTAATVRNWNTVSKLATLVDA